jgi:hypothetical protein
MTRKDLVTLKLFVTATQAQASLLFSECVPGTTNYFALEKIEKQLNKALARADTLDLDTGEDYTDFGE